MRSPWSHHRSQPDALGTCVMPWKMTPGTHWVPWRCPKLSHHQLHPSHQSGSSGDRTVSSGVQPVSLSEEEDEVDADVAGDAVSDIEGLVKTMTPSWDTPGGAFATGSESIYVGGVVPAGEADNTDFLTHQKPPECMRPLPILPANLAEEIADKTVVTQYAKS